MAIFNSPFVSFGAGAISHTGDTAEYTFASVTIPGGTLGPNGVLRVNPIWSITGSTNAKTLRVRLGGTAFSAQAIAAASTINTATVTLIANVGNQANQVGAGSVNAGTVAVVRATLDTSQDLVLLLTGQLASSGETVTLEGFYLEVVK
jgi:hypothetical protein